MTIHHPSAALLYQYATGRMPLAPAITVSAHLETCSACRGAVRGVEQTEGRRLEGSQPALMEPAAFADAMGGIDAYEASAPQDTATSYVAGITLPLATGRAGLGPRRWLAPGLWAAPVIASRADGWRAFLLRAPASTCIPDHRHKGVELIAVLAGAFLDGKRLDAGDFMETSADANHGLKVTAEGQCVCLIAIQGPVQWRGWARLITPLLGI